MARLQVGDKVRFLNEAIEGTVSKLLSNERVEVETADGFHLAAFGSELVRVEFEIGMAPVIPVEKEVRKTPEHVPAPVRKPVSLMHMLDPDDTVYAAVVLADELSPLTTDIELFLLNNTTFSMACVCSRKQEDTLTHSQAAILEPRAEKTMGIYSQDELHAMNGFYFSMLFFGAQPYRQLPPA